ncbi:hypothetical protein C8R43DRAFT_866728, partial [Mycena crocata]
MAEIARNYHNDLQHDESEDNPQAKDAAIEEVLAQREQHTAPPNMTELAKELTEQDVLRAVKRSPKGKAPGVDGIPSELWVRLYEIYRMSKDIPGEDPDVPPINFDVIKLITMVYNDIERNGVTKGTGFA